VKTTTNNLLLKGTSGNNPIQVDAGAGTNTLRIDASSFVGIGTATPATKLDVDGVITCTGLSTASGTFAGNITAFGTISAPFVTVTNTLSLNGANVVLDNTNKLIGEDTGAVQRNLAYVDGLNVSNFGDEALESTIHVATTSGLQVKIGTDPEVQIWHESNMGPGSGLNADLLDGIQGSDFLNWGGVDYFEANLGDLESLGGDDTINQILHELGSRPRLFRCYLLCNTVDRDWQVGDLVAYDSGATGSMITCFVNELYVGGVVNNSPNMNKKTSTFGNSAITWASWDFVVACWK
jgi:hypothetical protein